MKSLPAKIAICVLLCFTFGFLSGYLTTDAITGWYTTINKPSWQPPNWLFGPVWTVLYIMMGIAVALIWHSDHKDENKAITFFVVQFVLNMAWSLIFFNLHQIGFAFLEILTLLLFIILTIIHFYKINKTAAYLLIPYLAWVIFATILNGTIWSLN